MVNRRVDAREAGSAQSVAVDVGVAEPRVPEVCLLRQERARVLQVPSQVDEERRGDAGGLRRGLEGRGGAAHGRPPRGEPPLEGDHRLFVYLTTPEGDPLAETGGFGLPERNWEPGLLLKQWSSISVPATLAPGEYYALIGMERLDEGDLSLYVDEDGRPLGEAIPIGPLAVGQ